MPELMDIRAQAETQVAQQRIQALERQIQSVQRSVGRNTVQTETARVTNERMGRSLTTVGLGLARVATSADLTSGSLISVGRQAASLAFIMGTGWVAGIAAAATVLLALADNSKKAKEQLEAAKQAAKDAADAVQRIGERFRPFGPAVEVRAQEAGLEQARAQLAQHRESLKDAEARLERLGSRLDKFTAERARIEEAQIEALKEQVQFEEKFVQQGELRVEVLKREEETRRRLAEISVAAKAAQDALNLTELEALKLVRDRVQLDAQQLQLVRDRIRELEREADLRLAIARMAPAGAAPFVITPELQRFGVQRPRPRGFQLPRTSAEAQAMAERARNAPLAPEFGGPVPGRAEEEAAAEARRRAGEMQEIMADAMVGVLAAMAVGGGNMVQAMTGIMAQLAATLIEGPEGVLAGGFLGILGALFGGGRRDEPIPVRVTNPIRLERTEPEGLIIQIIGASTGQVVEQFRVELARQESRGGTVRLPRPIVLTQGE